MYKIVYTNRMKKDVRLMKKRGKDLTKLINVISIDGSEKEIAAVEEICGE